MLDQDTIQRYGPAKVLGGKLFPETVKKRQSEYLVDPQGNRVNITPERHVVSCDFLESFMITCDGVGRLRLFDVAGSVEPKIIKYSQDLMRKPSIIRFTHHPKAFLYSTRTRVVCYFSIYDNKVLHEYKGHDMRISSLEMSPVNDTFMTADPSGKVLIWDLAEKKNVAFLQFEAKALPNTRCCYHPDGHKFVAAFDTKNTFGNTCTMIHQYDFRKMDKPTFVFEFENHLKPSDIQYSTDGRKLLLKTAINNTNRMLANRLHVFEAPENKLWLKYDPIEVGIDMETQIPTPGSRYEWRQHYDFRNCAFDPTGRFVVTPSMDRPKVLEFHKLDPKTKKLVHIHTLDRATHPAPIDTIGWFPCSELLLTFCNNNTVFWLAAAGDDPASSNMNE